MKKVRVMVILLLAALILTVGMALVKDTDGSSGKHEDISTMCILPFLLWEN